MEEPPDGPALMAFHARRKMELLAHDEEGARALGRLAAEGRRAEYAARWRAVLAKPPTVGTHANALSHLVGHVRDRDAARALAAEVDAFRRGERALDDVKAALRARLEAEGATWAATQTYLSA